MIVEDILPTGKSNAVSGPSICSLLGWSNIRKLTVEVRHERHEGAPICATCDMANPGYYLAENKKEMQDYCRTLDSRIGELSATRDDCMKTIDSLPD